MLTDTRFWVGAVVGIAAWHFWKMSKHRNMG